MSNREIARRTLLAQTGVGLGGALAAGLGSGPAAAKAGADEGVQSQDYLANKGDLPNTAHSQAFSKNRQLLWYAMQNFLNAPAPIAG